MVSLYNLSKKQYHSIGLNSTDTEELRAEMVDYLLQGDFTGLERSDIINARLSELAEWANMIPVAHEQALYQGDTIPAKYTNFTYE